jgi:cold shock CspA family protein
VIWASDGPIVRYQGRVQSWNEARGFGFVAPNGGGEKAFLHISSFAASARRPTNGDLVNYEVEAGPKGPRAMRAAFVERERRSVQRPRSSVRTAAVGVAVLCALGYIVSIRVANPNSTIAASAYKATFARSALDAESRFRCEGKQYCSEMTSCAEAFFYQERCGATKLDGNHDGIPCESQWCR